VPSSRLTPPPAPRPYPPDRLDDVARGAAPWRDVLGAFWVPFAGEVRALRGLRTSRVVDVLDATMGVHFFGDDQAGGAGCRV